MCGLYSSTEGQKHKREVSYKKEIWVYRWIVRGNIGEEALKKIVLGEKNSSENC